MKIRTIIYGIILAFGVNSAIGQDGLRVPGPPTGTSGHTVPFLDGTNTWSAANAFGILTGTSGAFGGCTIGTDAFCVTGTAYTSGVFRATTIDLYSTPSSSTSRRGFWDSNGIIFNKNARIIWNANDPISGGNDLFQSRAGAASLQFGDADAASPIAQTLRVQSVVAGTAAANGANWTLIGSLPTGTGTSGDIIIQTGVKTGSGTTQGTATTALTIKGETQAVTSTGILSTSNTTDSTTTTTGALQSAGGLAVLKRVFFPGITASAGLQTAVLCQSSAGEVIADSVACLASSEAFKENIVPSDMGLDTVMALKPIVYKYKATGNERFDNAPNQRAIHAGFSAEQAATVDTRLIAYDAEGKIRTIRPDAIPAALVLAVQQQQAVIDSLRSRLERLETR